MDDRDVLPVRYGTHVADEASVKRILAEHHDRLADGLQRVRGATEVAVRAYRAELQSAELASEQSKTGTEYLRRRAEALAAEHEAIAAIHEPLSAIAREATLKPTRLAGELLCAAYLLERGDVARFGALLVELDEAHPELRLTSTGPWPPYSFAER